MRNSLIFILFFFLQNGFSRDYRHPFSTNGIVQLFCSRIISLGNENGHLLKKKNPGTIFYIAVSYLQAFELHMDKITQMIDRN